MNPRATLLILSLLICLILSSEIGVPGSQAGDQTIPDPPLTDQSISDRLIGEWQSAKFGRQTLTTNADGTAVLRMHLNTMAAILYGREVTLQLEWKLNGPVLTQQVVGGSPERSVSKLTRKYGTKYCYQIVTLSDRELIVEDTSTGKTCCWHTPPAGAAGK